MQCLPYKKITAPESPYNSVYCCSWKQFWIYEVTMWTEHVSAKLFHYEVFTLYTIQNWRKELFFWKSQSTFLKRKAREWEGFIWVVRYPYRAPSPVIGLLKLKGQSRQVLEQESADLHKNRWCHHVNILDDIIIAKLLSWLWHHSMVR